MKISKEVKTSVLVIAGIVLFIFGFNYLKGKNLLNSSRTYYTVYDNVEGLESSTPITINGLRVGKVISIGFKGDGSAHLLVEFTVDSDFEFSKNSKAELYETGLIGGKAIAVVPAFDGAPKAESGATLEGTIKPGLSELVNQRLTPLQEKVEKVTTSVNTAFTNLNDVFDEEAKAKMRKSIEDLDGVLISFKRTSDNLNNMLGDKESNLNKSLANVEHLSSNLSKVSDSLAQANLKSTINDLQSTLNNLNTMIAGINEGNGTMGKLMNDDSLYDNLEGATRQLEELLQDLKLNPKRYVHFSVFGKKAKQYDAEGNEIKDKQD
ncbi:MlaD family protein [Gaetbulibacter aestuarii]|uniref:MlaD family protein n=1 Tax=Gaetbulibacter aestuarii TaxID=1502358 RepID=A0ABW7MZC5_9FLAO